MLLRLGIMKTQELAEWMGISYSTFKKKKKEKLQELTNFCNFEEVYGGVNIIQIYEYKYNKLGSFSKQTIVKNLPQVWSQDGLDTCKRVGEEIRLKNNLPIASGTASKYAGVGRTKWFGKPYNDIEGSLGRCNYILCKTEGEGANTRYIRFTQEEEKIKEDLMKKYFGSVAEKTIIVKAMIEMGEIKKEQAWDVLEEMANLNRESYFSFLMELSRLLKCKVTKATNVERFYLEEEKSAF